MTQKASLRSLRCSLCVFIHAVVVKTLRSETRSCKMTLPFKSKPSSKSRDTFAHVQWFDCVIQSSRVFCRREEENGTKFSIFKFNFTIHSDEGLTLETSVFESFTVANLPYRPCG